MGDTGSPFLLKAPAKLNLSLKVLGRRPDGYHELVSLVGFADLHDRLVVELSSAGEDDLRLDGPFAQTLEGDNLVLQAIRAFRRDIAAVHGLRITLTKNIPVAAGLGGGSSDAAAILRFLARSEGIDPVADSVRRIAAALGADIPVCLEARSRYMRGTGTALDEPLPDRGAIPLLMINPRISVPTGPVFRALAAPALDPLGGPALPGTEAEIFDGVNDLEPPARSVAPVIGMVLEELKASDGARGARLSGSGATCFALFGTAQERNHAADRIRRAHPDWWYHTGTLKNWTAEELFS